MKSGDWSRSAYSSASLMVWAITSMIGFTGSRPLAAANERTASALNSSRRAPSASLVRASSRSSRRPTITGVFTYRSAMAAASG